MNFDPWTTPERLALRETAGAFVRRHVLPGLDDWEAAGEVPRELHREAAAAGLLGIGGGATEVLADLAGRLLGYAAGAR